MPAAPPDPSDYHGDLRQLRARERQQYLNAIKLRRQANTKRDIKYAKNAAHNVARAAKGAVKKVNPFD